MTDVNSELNELLSDAPVAGSEEITTTETTPAATTGTDAITTQPRDETGKFAAKGDDPAAVTDPVITDTQPVTTDKPNTGVPVRAVQEERQKRQDAEASAEALRREIAELRGTVQTLSQQRQQPAQAQQEQQPATLWDDPDNYLKSQLNPVQQEVSQVRNMLMRFEAVQSHGADAVAAALKAAEALKGTPQEAALEPTIMNGGNPFENLVKWHKQQETMSRVGNDPDAWLEAEMEKRLSDPAYQAKVIERIRGAAAQNANASGSAISLPPSLSGLPAGGNAAADNDMSDGALFSHALR